MDSPRQEPRSGWTRTALTGLAGALALLALWWPLHPARPPEDSGDLYTNLTVARHLARGEGFLVDVTYPLSFAHPFARRLPQPLIHRDPGQPLLLTAPCLAANGDPGRTVDLVRRQHWLLLGGIAGLGAGALLARRRPRDIAPWLILLGAHPLLAFAVDWGLSELTAALLLLGLWVRLPRAGRRGPRPADGLLAGALVLLRSDLGWVPLLWWLQAVWTEREAGRRRLPWRRLWLGPLVALLVWSPWLVRNAVVTGRPWFSLQAEAELVKMTRPWPGYSVYLQLEPQPSASALARDPLPILRKAFRGLRFYALNLHRLLPWPLLAAGAVELLRRRRRSRPAALAAATLLLLAGQYAWFDHSLRHLLVLVPILYWEAAALFGDGLRRALAGLPRWPRGAGERTLSWLLPPLVTGAVLWAAPLRLPGWDHAAATARADRGTLPARLEAAERSGSLFVTSSAVPWFSGRPGVWDPGDPAVRGRIAAWLGVADGGE